jgi:hypothetical protein
MAGVVEVFGVMSSRSQLELEARQRSAAQPEMSPGRPNQYHTYNYIITFTYHIPRHVTSSGYMDSIRRNL